MLQRHLGKGQIHSRMSITLFSFQTTRVLEILKRSTTPGMLIKDVRKSYNSSYSSEPLSRYIIEQCIKLLESKNKVVQANLPAKRGKRYKAV